MARERFSVDAKQLMTTLFRREAALYPDADVTVLTEPDADAALILPYVVIDTSGGRMVSNGPGGWYWIVIVSVVSTSEEEASDIADYLYEAIYSFHGNNGVVPGVGWVSKVEDLSLPDNVTPTTTPAGDLTQYTGSWTVLVRK